jgi:hypothetical protein
MQTIGFQAVGILFLQPAGQTTRANRTIGPMLLVVDIGNTNIVWGVYDDRTLAAHWRLATM